MSMSGGRTLLRAQVLGTSLGLLLLVAGCGSPQASQDLQSGATSEETLRSFAEPCSIDLETAEFTPLPSFLADVDTWYEIDSIDKVTAAEFGPVVIVAAKARALTRNGQGELSEGPTLERQFRVSEFMLEGSRWATTARDVDLVFAEASEGLVKPTVSYVIGTTETTSQFIGDCANTLKQDPLQDTLGGQFPKFVSELVGLPREALKPYVDGALTE